MNLSIKQIEATERRHAERESQRDEHSRRQREGSIVIADDPKLVEKRLTRIARTGMQPQEVARAIVPPGPIDVVSSSPEGLALERVLGQSDMMSVNYLEMALRAARTVGRVRILNGSGQTLGYGTGFMISPLLMLTNNHVLATAEEAERSRFELNYQEALDGGLQATEVFDLDPGTLFLTDEELDYSIVAVRADDAQREVLSSFGWNRLIEDEGKVIIGEYVNIIQHPNGEPKQVALRENQIKDRLELFLHYHTDTAPGSSGSPVFNDQWEVVALHHSGVPRRDAQGRILSRDGTLWMEPMGEHRIDWIANEGVRISRILRHVREQPLDATQDQFRNSLFEPGARSAPAMPATSASSRPRRQAPNDGPESVAQPVTLASAGSATWTIPLQISVQVGQPVMDGPTAATAAVTITGTGAVDQGRTEAAADAELREALRELEANRQRPYYAEVEDIVQRDAYYEAELDSGLGNSTMPADPQGAYERLSALLERTHQTRLSYSPSKHLYPWVDLRPDRKVQSIYSGQEFEPEELIREDTRIGQELARRAERLRSTYRSSAFGEATNEARLQEALDLLEASSPFNCEHVVPQSWFDKRQPMRGDLHHLFASEVGCNSFRGNAPYVDFEDFDEAVRGDCGKKEANRFEPEGGKGCVARATLYFLLRYGGEINRSGREYRDTDIETLLGWHRDNPPTEYEKHRNAAIYEKQGNRNPLIDFPEWAEQIDFTIGLG